MEAPEITIVVPVFNSEQTLRELSDEVRSALEGQFTFNMVLVNDGSSDRSYEVCQELAAADPRIRVISFFRNYGQLSAIMAGLRESDGGVVVVMDDDLQNPPSEIPRLVATIRSGYDFVFGVPAGQARQSLWRRLGSDLSVKMAEVVFQKPRGLYASSFYAVRRDVVREVVKYDGPFPYISGFIFRTTTNGCNLPVQHLPRKHGRSGYTLRKLVMLWFSGMTNFSVVPLRASSLLGLVASAMGAVGLAYVVLQKILNPQVIAAGWTSLMAIILFTGGVQLLALGMLGEYCGRMFLLLNKTPQYAIRDRINCGQTSRGD